MKDVFKTVLIADDIPYVRKTLKQILQNRGYRVVGEAENGDEAVRLYFETRPDLVVMDLVMPRMNGIDATRVILKRDPEAIIVILTAMTQENLVTEAIQAGAKDFVIKPFQTDVVMRVLEDSLSSGSSPAATSGGAA